MTWWVWAIGLPSIGLMAIKFMLRCNKFTGEITLQGKTAIITGANSGIGLELAHDLARRGGKIILACRDAEKGKQAANEIQKAVKDAKVVLKVLDLASFASIRAFVDDIIQEETRLDILVNNAGGKFNKHVHNLIFLHNNF